VISKSGPWRLFMKRKPTSPGEMLNEEFLKPLALSPKILAAQISCDYTVINRIVNEKTDVTPAMAMKLAAAFETTPDFWLNAQMALDLWKSARKSRRCSHTPTT
jgi:addiction module HigA family antidote